MKLLNLGFAVAIAAMSAFAVWADEEKIPLDKLPAKVKEAVKGKYPGAELIAAEKEKEGGKIVYEVAIKIKGQNIEVTVSEEGKIVSVEAEIAVKDLPKAVAEAFDKKYPKAAVKKVEEITKGEKISYELQITVGGKNLEVVFAADGKFLEEEDKSNEKKEK